MVFEYPLAFLYLLFIPIFYVARKLKILRKISIPAVLSDWNGSEFKWHYTVVKAASIISAFFFMVAYILTILAAASPVITNHEKIYTSRGTDILFIVDTSPSMASLDIGSGTRLDAAKTAIQLVVEKMQGASFGLVSMATESALTVPCTADYMLFLERLKNVNIGTLGDKTALGTGISTAVFHLIQSKAPAKCIILVTDGENNGGIIHPFTASKLVKNNNMVLYTIGVGTQGSVPLEYTDPITGKFFSGYLDSRFDEAQLISLSKTGGGEYFSATDVSELTRSLLKVSEKEKTAQTYQIKQITKHYYRQILFIAMISFILAWCIRRIYLKEYI